MNATKKKILDHIADNPDATYEQLATSTGVSVTMAVAYVRQLLDEKFIKKNTRWKILTRSK